MAVTWIDTPDVTLGSTDEPIDFTATGVVSTISVNFGAPWPEERAYRDGAFLHPYTGSSRNGQSFSLRRIGGWLRTPYVWIDEEPEPKLTAWSTLYEIDFSAQPSQWFHGYLESSLQTNRAVTIGGRTWNCWNGSASSYGQRLTQGTGVSLHADGRYWDPTVARVSAGAFLSLSLSQLPGYDPTKATAVLARVHGNAGGGGLQQGGVALFSDSRWSTNAPYQFTGSRGMVCHFETQSTLASVYYGTQARAGGRPVAPAAIDRVYGVVRDALGLWGYGVNGPWTGSFGTVESMEPVASGNLVAAYTEPLEAAFIVGSNGVFGQFCACSHMRILQRS